ncbi:hypothetical protein Agub_g3218 [Astrephomene gubernaculifera]|uniref:Uncharacterized protein n=1 Tax=Astrephomene gubernaculifera TaxID=47775 RepID=A0AAD3DKV8_9CHLO|nr:hypothetical protein Agub_g3218 [Astrephomene gubernaculifera]
MTSRTNGALFGLPDRFVAVEIETEATPAFDAAQYSFFGDLSAADTGLEGALEDGLEGPPAEEGISSQDYGLHGAEEDAVALGEEEDLSVASIFRSQLRLGAEKTKSVRVDQDEDAALDALLTDPLSVARKQLQDDYYDQNNLPAELYSPSGPDTRQAAGSQSLFGPSSDATYGSFDGYNPATQAAEQHGNGDSAVSASQSQQQQLAGEGPAAGPPAGTSLLHMLKKPQPPPQPAKAMTLEELEARMLSSAAAAHSPEPTPPAGGLQAGGPPPMPPPQHLQGMYHHMPLLPGQPVPPGDNAMRLMPPPPPGMGPPPGYHPSMNALSAPPGMHPHGSMPPPRHVPPPQHPHMQHHGLPGVHGPMPPPHMMMGPPPPGSPGAAGMYPPPPPGGHMLPGVMMHPAAHNGMPQHPHHQGMPPGPPPGAMMPPPYGPGGFMPRPMQYGPPPSGMAGPPPSMHDGYQMRPMSGPPGAPGPMMGQIPARPTGPYGPAPGPANSAAPGPQRPPATTAATLPPPPNTSTGSAGQRPAPVLGPGAAGQQRPAPQARSGGDLGQQFARGSSGPASGSAAAGGGAPAALAAAAGAAGRAGGATSGPGGRLGGKWMRPEDVEYVVRSMLYSVANGVPYVEDYYFQAFVHKYVSRPSRQQLSPGAFPMAAPFVPEALRDLSEEQMHMMRLDPSARVKFVEGIQGLGKIVLSNIRTPKVLMDLSDQGTSGGAAKQRAAGEEGATGASKSGADESGRAARPLEQEPLLAARIMIEDCMNLLLDMDDIDRLATHMAAMAQAHQRAAAVAAAMPVPGGAAAAAAGAAAAANAAGGAPVAPYGPSSAAPPPPSQLRQRRELLLVGINGAFRLPGAPKGSAAAGSTAGMEHVALGDGVLLRILALSKGRSVVARALMAIAPPASLATKTTAQAAQQQQRPASQGAAGKSHADGSAAPSSQDVQQGSDAAAGLLGADTPSPYVLLWATLRNAWSLFGSSLQGVDAATERPMLEATARLAAAMRDALLRLPTARDVVDAAAAFNAGCLQHAEALIQGGNAAAASSMEATLLPLAQTRALEAPAAGTLTPAHSAWLGEALAALVTRASQLGLSAAPAGGEDVDALLGNDRGAKPGKEPAATEKEAAEQLREAVDAEWGREFGELHERLSRHLATLGSIHSMAQASGNAEALAVVRALSCRQLVNAMLPHVAPEQLLQLRGAMQAFTA